MDGTREKMDWGGEAASQGKNTKLRYPWWRSSNGRQGAETLVSIHKYRRSESRSTTAVEDSIVSADEGYFPECPKPANALLLAFCYWVVKIDQLSSVGLDQTLPNIDTNIVLMSMDIMMTEEDHKIAEVGWSWLDLVTVEDVPPGKATIFRWTANLKRG